MTETLNAVPRTLGPTIEPAAVPAPAPVEPVYRLTISHGQFGVPEPLKIDGDLPLRIGDEVNALVRIRVTGRTEREPYAPYDSYTITTDAKIVEFIEVDGTPLPKPEPTKDAQKVITTKAARRGDRVLYVFLGACLTVAALSMLQGLITALH